MKVSKSKSPKLNREFTQRRTRVPIINDIRALLPQQPQQPITLVDIIRASAPKYTNGFKTFPLAEILNNRYELTMMLFKFNQNIGIDNDSGDDYEKYLQVSDRNIRSLAQSIVSYSDTNDQKMYKIEQWVINNIEYKSDISNYGVMEYWAYPTITLNRESGDCEDGAFLMHSLAVAAGIPYNQLRTYGGYVQETEGSYALGGHAWTAYKRETDNEWVEVDWCYYPTDTLLNERVLMKNDMKYVDDFFYVDIQKTVDTMLTNRIRKPYGYTGGMINTYA